MTYRAALGVCALALMPWVSHAQYTDSSGALNPKITDNIGIDDKRRSIVPLATEFTDESGKKILLRDVIKTRPVIVMPIFYNCNSSCNLIFNGVLDCVRDFKTFRLGQDYDMVCISIDPAETAKDAMKKKGLISEVVHDTLHKQGVENGWHFLTGSPKSVQTVTQALGFRYQLKQTADGTLINHPAGIMILTRDGVISRYFYGVDYVPKMVMDALKTADAQKIGPEAQKILFGCLEYDPTKGKYKLVVLQALKVSGIATVLALICSIVVMERRRRTSTPN
ncbi:MAG: SCO family protein [Chthonomonas sp.]|nr:SCO family protein [Chthonomonas sp.]